MTRRATAIGIGNRIAPARFLAFIALIVVGAPIGVSLLGWRVGSMAAFDVAAIVFMALCLPLLKFEADDMRKVAEHNDANRAALLAITGIVMLVVLVAVAAELAAKDAPKPPTIALIVGTLALAWVFSNTMYTLHYAHLYYSSGETGDCRGVKFPDTDEPDYWDFVYFAFCLGMTFQTSDVDIETGRFRRVVTAQCLAAFVFNLGIVAFTINVLGGG